MAGRRGRPSKAAQEQQLQESVPDLIAEFNSRPIRVPVDSAFGPYYERFLQGDVKGVLEYRSEMVLWGRNEHSFDEFLGRLIQVQSLPVAKLLLSQLVGPYSSFHESLREGAYLYWYGSLLKACTIARAFIRSEYEENHLIKAVELWPQYMRRCYVHRRAGGAAVRSREVQKLIDWAEHKSAVEDENPTLVSQIDRFVIHFVVPKAIFRDLGVSYLHGSGHERDKRYRARTFTWTPSSIARRYACQMVGISPSTISHKNRRK